MEEDEEVEKGDLAGAPASPLRPPPSPPGRSIQPPSPTTRPTTSATLLIIHSHPKSPRLIIFVIAKEKSRKLRNNVQLYRRERNGNACVCASVCVRACVYLTYPRNAIFLLFFFFSVLGETY